MHGVTGEGAAVPGEQNGPRHGTVAERGAVAVVSGRHLQHVAKLDSSRETPLWR